MSTHNQAAGFRGEHDNRHTAESPMAKVNPRPAEIAGPLLPATGRTATLVDHVPVVRRAGADPEGRA